jgi:hypothetical protein
MRGTAPAIGAATFGLLHVVLVAWPLISSGGSGESQAFLVTFLDFPLFAALSLFRGGRSLLYNGPRWAYVSFFVVAGTLMYCWVGVLIGVVADWLINIGRPRHDSSQ